MGAEVSALVASPDEVLDPVGGAAGAAFCAPPAAILEAWAAACLHLSDTAYWFCLRQAMIRPPPGVTLEQNLRTSSAQPAVKICPAA